MQGLSGFPLYAAVLSWARLEAGALMCGAVAGGAYVRTVMILSMLVDAVRSAANWHTLMETRKAPCRATYMKQGYRNAYCLCHLCSSRELRNRADSVFPARTQLSIHSSD